VTPPPTHTGVPADARPARDHAVEQLLGNFLRWSVLTAAAIVLAGGLLYLARHGGEPVSYRTFHGQPAQLTTLRGIAAGALALDARAVLQLGVLALVATPILRVAFSLVAFLVQRDRMYVLITAIVLALLAFSLLGGHAAH
jgi:uncharacterized membrane protein